MSRTRARRAALTIAATVAFLIVAVVSIVPATALAQEPLAFDGADRALFPPNALVANYTIDPAALEDVTTVAELVAALREHLMVEAAMPLFEPLYVNLYANVASPRASNAYMFQHGGFTFALKAEAAVASDLASVIRASHEAETFSDWDEDETWAALREVLENGLADPASPVANGSGVRPRDADGNVPIRIVAVHNVTWEEKDAILDSFERDWIEIRPDPDFGSSAMAGYEPPEDLTYETNNLLFELEPSPEAAEMAAALPEPTAVELSPEALDRFVGSYELQPGSWIEFRREGSELVARTAGEGADDEFEPRLTPFSDTEFWTDVEDNRFVFSFNVDGGGAVESVAMEIVQEGFTHTLPRMP